MVAHEKFFIVVDNDGDHIDCLKHKTKAEAIDAAREELGDSAYSQGYYVAEIVAHVGRTKQPATVLDL